MGAGPVPWLDTELGPWADLLHEGTSLVWRSAYRTHLKLGNALSRAIRIVMLVSTPAVPERLRRRAGTQEGVTPGRSAAVHVRAHDWSLHGAARPVLDTKKGGRCSREKLRARTRDALARRHAGGHSEDMRLPLV